ncbi:MAG TPA: hypothetical protein VGK54_06990, partial [Chloroflexota bacterium]
MSRFRCSLMATALAFALFAPQVAMIAFGESLAPVAKIDIPGVGFTVGARGPSGSDIITYDPGTKMIYLANGRNNAVDVFDPATNKMVYRIPLLGDPHQVYVDNDKGLLYAALGTMKVAIVRLGNGGVQYIDVGGTSIADLIGYDPDDSLLVVGSKGEAFLSFISISPDGVGSLASQLPLPGDSPEEPKYDPVQHRFLLTLRNTIAVIDPISMSITDTWDLAGCGPHEWAFGPNREAMIGCSRGEQIINLDTGAIVASIPNSVVGDTDQPTYDPKTNRYYAPGHVARDGANVAVLAVVDAATREVINVFDIDPGSYIQGAVDPTSGNVYIA